MKKKWFSTASGLLIKVSQITKTDYTQTLMVCSQMTRIFPTSSMLKCTHSVRLWVKRGKHKNDQMEKQNTGELNQYFTLVLQSLCN